MLLVFERDDRLAKVVVSFSAQALSAILTRCVIQDLLQGLLNLLFKLDWISIELDFVVMLCSAEQSNSSATVRLPNSLCFILSLALTALHSHTLSLFEHLPTTVLGIKGFKQVFTVFFFILSN